MIERRVAGEVLKLLTQMPAVALLGPRQSGKTTLALEIAAGRPSVYLDLESPADRARLTEPLLYLSDHADELVILDEIHRAPDLFEVLRGVIDEGRREGKGIGRFLLLGSAAIGLLSQSSETLAGRIAFVELSPFDATEIGDQQIDRLWMRGGFPESFLAADDASSLRWRESFIRTYLERDIPQLGPRIPAETLRRLWTMLAHHQGGLLNAAHIARSLGVSSPTVAHYVDLLVDLLLVRRLPPHVPNIGKRLVRSPKVYIRDTGLLHALLGIPDREAILGHPIVGPSFEGMVIENLLTIAGPRAHGAFYRTTGGAEIDLLVNFPNGRTWAVEVKRSLAPKLERGFYQALADVEPERAFVAYPGTDRYRLGSSIEAIGVGQLCVEMKRLRTG